MVYFLLKSQVEHRFLEREKNIEEEERDLPVAGVAAGLDFLGVGSLPGPGHLTVTVPLDSGAFSPFQIVVKFSASTVHVLDMACIMAQSSVFSAKLLGKTIFESWVWPGISRMGKKPTPKFSPSFSLGWYSARAGSSL